MTRAGVRPATAHPLRDDAGEEQTLRFEVAGRTLLGVRRRLVRVGHSLPALLNGTILPPPPLGRSDGYLFRSLPEDRVDSVVRRNGAMVALLRQRYPRHFIRLDTGFAEYMNQFSAKTRSTLRRKRKRWIAEAGSLDVRAYRDPDEVAQFYGLARGLSAMTYQERLLNAGLPSGEDALDRMRELAGQGRARGYILFHHGRPASYLYLPVDEGTVLYAHLGYDPAFSALSPGTVLQLAVLEELFEDPSLAFFDFTEGDGEHKRLFGTDQIACADLLLLRRSLANLLLTKALTAFDDAIAAMAKLSARFGIKGLIRRFLRRDWPVPRVGLAHE